MGNELFKIILSLSISGTIIGILIFLLKPIIKDKFSKKWQYYIWLILMLRMLFPITIEANIVGNLFEHVEKKLEQLKNVNDSKSTSIAENFFQNTNKQIYEEAPKSNFSKQEAVLNSSGSDSESNPVQFIFNELLSHFWLIWLFGAMLTFAIKVVDYKNFIRYIKSNNIEIKDEKILSMMDDALMDYGIKKNIVLYQNKLIISPILAGCFHPFIVLPEGALSTDKMNYIFFHELTHFKRKDIWYKWLFQIVQSIHWFNPCLYFISKEINQCCELSCDEAVINKLDKKGRMDYGNMLLDIADLGITYRNNVLSTTLIEDKKYLKARIQNITEFKKPTKVIIGASILGIFMIILASIVVGAKSNDNNITDSSMVTSNQLTEPLTNDNQNVNSSNPNNINNHINEIKDSWSTSMESLGTAISDSILSNLPTIPPFNDKENEISSMVYYNNSLISQKDICNDFISYEHQVTETYGTEIGRFSMTGSNTITTCNVSKDTTLNINYSAEIESGEFKLVSINSDNEVTTLVEGTTSGSLSIPLLKGHNVIKMVGLHCTVNHFKYTPEQIDKNVLISMSSSEAEEKESETFSLPTNSDTIDLEMLFHNINNLDSEEVSHYLLKLMKDNQTLTDSEWQTLAIYSDNDILDNGILELIDSGDIPDSKIFTILVPYVDEETVSNYIVACFNTNTNFSNNELEIMAPFADGDILDAYILDLLDSNTLLDFNIFSRLLISLDSETVSQYIIYDLKHQESLTIDQLKELSPYGDRDVLDELFPEILKMKPQFSYNKFYSFFPYLDSDAIESCICIMIKARKPNIINFLKENTNNLYSENIGSCVIEAVTNNLIISYKDFVYFLDDMYYDDIKKGLNILTNKNILTKKQIQKITSSYL